MHNNNNTKKSGGGGSTPTGQYDMENKKKIL